MERTKLKDKLKNLKKQLRKDKKEGRIKHDHKVRSKCKHLFKKLDPFNMKCLVTEDHKSKVRMAKIKLMSNKALEHAKRLHRERSISLHPINKCDLPRCPFTKKYRSQKDRELSLRKESKKDCCEPEQKYLNDEYDF